MKEIDGRIRMANNQRLMDDAEAFARSLEYQPEVTDKKIIVVSDKGTIDRLSVHQKNAAYAQAKILRERIRERLLTLSQLWIASEENIKRHLMTESTAQHTKEVEQYRNLMKLVGADKEEISIEKMRKA